MLTPYILSNKSAAPQCTARFYPIRWPRVLSLQHDWLKFAKSHLFLAKAVCHKKAGFSHFEPIVTNNEIFRQSDMMKNSRSLRRSHLYCLECIQNRLLVAILLGIKGCHIILRGTEPTQTLKWLNYEFFNPTYSLTIINCSTVRRTSEALQAFWRDLDIEKRRSTNPDEARTAKLTLANLAYSG